MEYRGLAQTFREWMARLHARSFVDGVQIGSAVLADPGPGTTEEKLNRAMEAYFNDPQLIMGTPPPLSAGELPTQRRGPGRPRRDGSPPNHNGKLDHDAQ